MIKIERGSSSDKKNKRIGRTAITLLGVFVASFVLSGTSFRAKVTPITLNAAICA